MNAKTVVAGVSIALATYSVALAHHSAAMFDQAKTNTVTGTVKQFQWTNPHAWLYVTASDGAAQKDYSVEMTSPNLLQRAGWRPGTLKPGDKISLRLHPFYDGGMGGQLVDVTLPDGKVMADARTTQFVK